MNIDTQKLKDECRRKMEQAYREGWKAGYESDSPTPPPRTDPEWLRGWHDGKAECARDAYRYSHEASWREPENKEDQQ